MKDTVSGVPGGVSPKAVAPGSAATLVPCCTGVWVPGLGLGLAARGDAEAAGVMIAIVASAAPVTRLTYKERVINTRHLFLFLPLRCGQHPRRLGSLRPGDERGQCTGRG